MSVAGSNATAGPSGRRSDPRAATSTGSVCATSTVGTVTSAGERERAEEFDLQVRHRRRTLPEIEGEPARGAHRSDRVRTGGADSDLEDVADPHQCTSARRTE
jgi:hypothetical protein